MVFTSLLLLAFLAADDKPAPKLPIGKETTYVSGPLDKEEFIGNEAALNDRLGKGITPEKNANVLLWKALGPRKGYLLYSVGPNGRDEEGRGPEDDPPGDDLSVRVPLPALKPKK